MIEELNVYPADYKNRLQVWNDFIDMALKCEQDIALEVCNYDLCRFWNKLFEGYPVIQSFYPIEEDE